MTGKPNLFLTTLSRFARRGFSKPRRRLLLAGAALAGGAALWRGNDKTPRHTDAQIMEWLADRLLPASGPNPGARALGVDKRLVERHRKGSRYLDRLVAVLTERDFPALDDPGRDALIAELLNDRTDRDNARAIRYALDFLN
ncbi:MAG: hypothetical protein DWQ08_11575 [Proteobacteria bacterium]|nr:MAG: hypothetical protein DWQ08_11575 [Pseudomonadota bacterium]